MANLDKKIDDVIKAMESRYKHMLQLEDNDDADSQLYRQYAEQYDRLVETLRVFVELKKASRACGCCCKCGE